MIGLLYASVPAVGSALCELGRKRLTKGGMDAPTLVSLICLAQGLIGMAGYTISNGGLTLPSTEFWKPALLSAVANAFSKTLQTIAYNKGDVSLCAPFSASLPIFQFLVTTFVWGDEAKFPPHRILGVFSIGVCGFWLSKAGRASVKGAPLLPPGAGYILTQCEYSVGWIRTCPLLQPSDERVFDDLVFDERMFDERVFDSQFRQVPSTLCAPRSTRPPPGQLLPPSMSFGVSSSWACGQALVRSPWCAQVTSQRSIRKTTTEQQQQQQQPRPARLRAPCG